ncbi:hypothetical protein KKC60_05880 [Patescibacteria group bacterium]|nr:hypothetical protein [Patescibacteria group bacterium]
MKKKTLGSIAVVVLFAVMLVGGVAMAASERNITSLLGGVDGDFFNVDGTMMMDSVKIGRQGEGGVTFFNGTIVNNTTNDSVDNPVTFGDNVRIDGRIWRGATSGPEAADVETQMPVIINDDFTVLGDATFTSGRTVDFTGATTTGLTAAAYKQVGGTAFQPEDPNVTAYTFANGYLTPVNAAGFATSYVTSVDFTDDRIIDGFQVRGYDDSATTEMTVELYKVKSDYSAERVAQVTSGDAASGGNVTFSTTMDTTLDTENNSYYLKVTFENGNDRLYDVRFHYTSS